MAGKKISGEKENSILRTFSLEKTKSPLLRGKEM
jgi:hypothetical protein